MTQAPRPRPRTVLLLVPVLLLSAVLATGCSGGDDEEPSAAPSSSLEPPDDAPTFDVEPVVRLGTVVGKLGKKERAQVRDRVARVAQRWMDAAYLGGDYPRGNFQDAWVGFTHRAKQLAGRDRGLTSNKNIGPRIDSVTPTKIAVRVDLVTVKRRPVGSTAHVLLTFDTTGKVERSVRIAGRLLMTPTQHGWKVFAYDLTRGAR